MAGSRINLTLTDDALKTLENYARESGVDIGTYIKSSLQVMNTLQDEKKQRHRLYIGTNDRIIKELDLT